MSRNALKQLSVVALIVWLIDQTASAADFTWLHTNAIAHVLIVSDTKAVFEYEPNIAVVQKLVNRGITQFTGRTNLSAAWLSLVKTNDIIGIKVYANAGAISGTRPAVVAGIIHGLIAAGIPPNNIIIWDKYMDDLRNAGFLRLANELGVRAAGSFESGYDENSFYNPDTAIVGQLVWGDLEFGKKGDGIGRKSYVSQLVSREITKIISVAPLLNDYDAGVSGHLVSLALGSVDNTRRFEVNPARLAVAIPEIYALPQLSDRVVVNITDALIGQYAGSSRVLLQYSEVLNQLWFSHDPVALDTLALKELEHRRREMGALDYTPNLEIYTNANLLQLGINDPAKILTDTGH